MPGCDAENQGLSLPLRLEQKRQRLWVKTRAVCEDDAHRHRVDLRPWSKADKTPHFYQCQFVQLQTRWCQDETLHSSSPTANPALCKSEVSRNVQNQGLCTASIIYQ